MIKRALILAAGFGSRLREGGLDIPKPLQLVSGETLLSRTVTTLAAAGVEDIWVVVGFRKEELEAAVAAESARWAAAGARVHTIANPEFDKSNGVSVLCA